MLPSTGKIRNSRLLVLMNLQKLSLLSDSHVMTLSILFMQAPFDEDSSHPIRLEVIILRIAELDEFVYQFEESHDFLIWDKIDTGVWEQGSIFLFYANHALSN